MGTWMQVGHARYHHHHHSHHNHYHHGRHPETSPWLWLTSPMTSLRESLCILLVVALLSLTITLHLGHHLSKPLQPNTDDAIKDGLNIPRVLRLNDEDHRGDHIIKGDNASSQNIGENGVTSLSRYKNLLKLLQKLEGSSTVQKGTGPLEVLIAGSNSNLEHEATLIKSAFKKNSVHHQYLHLNTDIPFSETSLEHNGIEKLQDSGQGRWSILICLNTSNLQDACVVAASQNISTQPYQKVNVIHPLQRIISQPQLLCQPSSKHGDGRWYHSDLPCTNLSNNPLNTEESHQNITSCRKHPLLILPLLGMAGTKIEVCIKHNLQTRKAGDGAVSLGITNWYKAWQFMVLVTSLSPLRIYFHPDGIAWDSLESFLTQKSSYSLSLLELQQTIANHYGENLAALTLDYLKEAIMRIFLQWEFASQEISLKKRQRGFQLLQMTAFFNSTFYPFILQVSTVSYINYLSSLNAYLMRQTTINDMVAILLEQKQVASEVASGLIDMGLTNIVKNKVCNTDRIFCLGSRELIYLLDSRREASAKTAWKRVYPCSSAVQFTGLLQMKSVERSQFNSAGPFRDASVGDLISSSWRTILNSQQNLKTAHLHSLLLSLESFYLRTSDNTQADSYDDVDIPVESSHLMSGSQDLFEKSSGPPCNDDPSTMPYLSAILTEPELILKPSFSPVRTEYEAEINSSMSLVTLWAWTQNCMSQAHIEDRHNSDRFVNCTLGLGENVLRVFVVDTSHEEPWVLNTYTLRVRRLTPDHGMGTLQSGTPHIVCRLKQDCSLPFVPGESCGLQSIKSLLSWQQFLAYHSALPACNDGDSSGEWYVPCSSCHDGKGQCYWQDAVWSSKLCRNPVLAIKTVQRCFSGKKVLFIGDSTNRGILNYLSQRVNGSLWEWEKTHHLRVYPPLNNNLTQFGFAYYPQFWLPAQHRPVFDKALYQLIRRMSPLENSTNTVIIVGGVHWLATHHLKVIISALTREGLTGALVVVKGLGSGFHQPATGVHQLSQKEQEKLLWHNQHVLEFAHQHGMKVVDTFNMTMARYKHYLQGRCSCHFHRVTTAKSSKKVELNTSTYHVEGDINAAYAEMVINRICQPT